MARFSDLNEDVLTLVLSHLEDHRPTLRALALTCSLLSRIATPLLYRTVGISLKDSQPDHRFDRLFRTLNQSDKQKGLQLTSYIRNVCISWRGGNSQMHHPDTVEFLHSIEKTRNLSLFIYNYPFRQYISPYTEIDRNRLDFSRRADLGFWDLSRLRHLRELTLSFDNPLDDLARFMCLTPVGVIWVYHIVRVLPDTFCTQNLPRRRKPLTKLSLHTHFSYETVTKILATSAGVEHLDIFEPGILSGNSTTICIDGRMPIMSTAYSPQRLSFAMAPLYQTLETLKLISGDTIQWPHHDSTRLDLRPFTHLTRANVDSKFFFPPSIDSAHREDPTSLLPRNLASLTLAFDTATTALGPSGSSYQWLLALVQRAPHQLPRLHTLHILEQDHQGQAFCQVCVPVFGIYDWDPPADAQHVLSKAADILKVKVGLRVWRREDPDDDEEGVPGLCGTKAGGPPVIVPPPRQLPEWML